MDEMLVQTSPAQELAKAAYSGLTCPECGSALCELPDPGIVRFRCRSGHAFSAQSLLWAQKSARESLQSMLCGRVREESSLAMRLITDPRYRNEQLAELLGQRIDDLNDKATQLLLWGREPPACLLCPRSARLNLHRAR